MDYLLKKAIISEIIEAYGSTSSPNWSFVSKRHSREPYHKLVASLNARGIVEETTDLNYDVSLALSVSTACSTGIGIMLSLVGRYACLLDHAGRPVSQDSTYEIELVNKVTGLLEKHEVKVLQPEDLATQIDFDNSSQTIYSVLFSAMA